MKQNLRWLGARGPTLANSPELMERLLQADVIHEKEDIYYLTFEELREVVSTNELDRQIINKRRAEELF